ncbi:hypothetical protein HW561_16290 [Rhodobacteraceae bacterium B1Z28]|uniref:Carrier domain-containing protein n=1 Tax=Ruegeria haliotis TaxID=2747601 RepID=A0ABX2PT53_9RHOB|nr:phosphopantetheine-binding protein [Ruegeria haliotis]NVO57355.1 hypothetical protein [Ruegeria haliotis]
MKHLDDIPEGGDNLLDYGLNSITFMTLITRWEALGLKANFNTLARNPTLNAILAALADQLEPGEVLQNG